MLTYAFYMIYALVTIVFSMKNRSLSTTCAVIYNTNISNMNIGGEHPRTSVAYGCTSGS